MAHLFDSFTLAGVHFKNRIGMTPMCQYSAADDGIATDWHVAHLGQRAVGGVGLVIVEATAVEARGRISRADLGLWNDAQIEPLARIVRLLEAQGAVPGIQLAHAGRKAAVHVPWEGGRALQASEGGWPTVAPSAVPFASGFSSPEELSQHELAVVRQAFVIAAARARTAGFRLLELHGAHGYLLHSFLSPLSNRRSDAYGGSFEGRIRFPLEVVRAVREHWPSDRVLAFRVSATDWVEGGWTPDETVELARRLEQEGVDLVDCSSGGSSPTAPVPVTPGYQVGFAASIKHATNLATAAVGLITEAKQAEAVVERAAADIVLLGRELLRNPYWALTAAQTLGVKVAWPVQYERAQAQTQHRPTYSPPAQAVER